MQELNIALGNVHKSRQTKTWKNTKVTWENFAKKLSETTRTQESYKQYCSFSKEQQSDIKDKGAFVGGYLTDGKRHPNSVKFRQVLTLDLDTPEQDFWLDFTMLYSCTALLHTTHKHSPKSPRFRLIIPIDRKVSAIEYEAIARKLAGVLGINLFDPTTFQPERLMYWPTTSKDGEFICEQQQGTWLSAEKILSSYTDFEDISEWPMHDAEQDFIKLGGKQQGNPLEKPGFVGAFCRTYDIHEAIAEFLSDVYEQTTQEDRYTYVGGSSASGAIVYDNLFLYSHHGTDPAGGKLLNAYDLVRMHKYGFEDEGEKELSKQKSNKLMAEFAGTLDDVRYALAKEKLSAADDFDDYTEEETDWLKKLTLDSKTHEYEATIDNFYLILANDPALKGRLKYNEFSHRECGQLPLPWAKGKELIDFVDSDDAALKHYVEKKYNMYNVPKYNDAVKIVCRENSFHPIREYIDGLSWDNTERLETLLIDYLAAEDTAFNREVTRKAFVAAVARVYNPGCKFDYVLTTVGPEGIGKSTILDKLGSEWFSDSFAGVEGQKAYEALQGAWIIEIAELNGFKKSEVEAVKHFVAKRVDRFRVAFGKRVEAFPRQCGFYGTTNEFNFLKGINGDRRFWPVVVDRHARKMIADMPVDQIWAEAKVLYDQGEKLYLDAIMEETAREIQKRHTEIDDRSGNINRYLSTLLPADWDTMDIHERRAYLGKDEEIEELGVNPRERVCIAEIWVELFRAELKDMGPHNTKHIHQIMNAVPGWERHKSNLTFPLYGKQRAYVPVGTPIRRSAKRTINE